ncbi:MAG TPA: phage Gp37/Gp68 family protein [Gammaproteobacteria bacterium]|nr:phage Gp37/Gp68 family protein [Gammaproteobacteria bacterium]
MPKKSNIEWTEMTWNPVTGCTKISQGCKHCYAETMAKRLVAMGSPRYRHGFKIALQEDLVDLPKRWRNPRTIFVNSMSDLFHPDIPVEFIQRVFKTMNECPQHVFQVLTKRADRLVELSNEVTWSPNIWMGVSVENQKYAVRANLLKQVPAHVRFLSVEPLLSAIPNLPLAGIHWVIVGGESGRGARPMDPKWVQEIFHQCRAAKVPFFFKQWGGVQKKVAGRKLFGRTYDEMPIGATA